MSTALRIASVTQLLRTLLRKGLTDNNVDSILGGGGDVVSIQPLDRIVITPTEPTQLNLYMYQVTYNQGWRNVGQPMVNQKGERIASPPLALDLHYLLTAFGKDELFADILLSYGMQVFHETPILESKVIRTFLSPAELPELLKKLSTSELADQVEQVKITPELLSIEDISKLWAAFGAKYRTTAAYKVTVVLIESNKSFKPGLPVINRNIYVDQIKQPVIEKILSRANDLLPFVEDQKILFNYTLKLDGKLLRNANVEIDIDGNPDFKIPTSSITISDQQLIFILPQGLKAGTHEIEVVHPAMMGTPVVAHVGIKSKVFSFTLSPSIKEPIGKSGITVVNGFVSGNIDLKVEPELHSDQRVVLFLNEITGAAETQAKAYSFKMPPLPVLSPPGTTGNISIKINNVKKAIYLVRVSVDGAESPLISTLGKYVSPKIDLS